MAQLGLKVFADLNQDLGQTMENSTHENEGLEHFQETHFCLFFKQMFFLRFRDMPLHKLRKREDWTVRRFFLSLLIDHMMTKYLIVIYSYHLHRQLSK
jgi:hypothetical protein